MVRRGERGPLARFAELQAARELFRDYIDWVHQHPSPHWVFRGQASIWPLRPKIGRNRYQPELEQRVFIEFKRLAVPMVDRSQFLDDWDWLALAQHYGLPTRLLDWSTNALVALFFAIRSSSGDGSVVAVSQRQVRSYDQAEGSPFEIEEVGFVKPAALAGRIVAQKGLFSIHPKPDQSWGLNIVDSGDPWSALAEANRFSVPQSVKSEFQKLLFALGVDDAFLMGDLEGLSRTLQWRLENGDIGP